MGDVFEKETEIFEGMEETDLMKLEILIFVSFSVKVSEFLKMLRFIQNRFDMHLKLMQ